MVAFAAQTLWFKPDHDMLPHYTLTTLTSRLMNDGMPTYFVDEEFAEAVLETEPPEGFRFGDLQLPVPSMLFVLPSHFVLKNFGWYVPFFSASKLAKGDYPNRSAMPKCRLDWAKAGTVRLEAEQFLMHYPRFLPNEMPVDFTGAYPASVLVSDIAIAPFTDATIFERRIHGLDTDTVVELSDADKLAAAEEVEITKRLSTFLIKLVLVLTAAPNHVREGGMDRARKVKKGKLVRDALWAPSVVSFGRTVSAPRQPRQEGERTVRPPRMHWRKRHMTHQVYGPRDSQISIHELPKLADGKVDWPNASKDLLDRFWACHKLKWVEPTLINKE